MNEVVLRAAVKQATVPGGLAMEITGAGRTEQAIGAMVVPHAVELDRMPDWSARTETIPGGVRLTVVARKPEVAPVVARIRGLGFAGLITEGAHHQAHHLAMARGTAPGHTH
jgi:predicted RNA binding protein YcfA (HicA-like mRNA interferase family)